MSWRTTIRFFVIPAIALVITVKLGILINHLFGSYGSSGQVTANGDAQIGGSFILFNQDHKIVSDKDLQGKPILVYFGFTHCPDVCPTDMALITNIMQALGDDAKKIQPVFITIDPMRDTPEQLKKFLANFYPGVIGLTGTPEQIADIVNKYHVYAHKVESKEISEYLMDHSAFIYLMGKDGKYITHFNDKQDAGEVAGKVRENL